MFAETETTPDTVTTPVTDPVVTTPDTTTTRPDPTPDGNGNIDDPCGDGKEYKGSMWDKEKREWGKINIPILQSTYVIKYRIIIYIIILYNLLCS